jgi:hypothetical protein
MLRFKQGLVQWRWLSQSGDVVAQICLGPNLRSRHPGQHVLPHVRYGMSCLLIRNTIGCVFCSVE